MIRLGVGAVIVAGATYAVGWFAVPAVGLVMGAIRPGAKPVLHAAAAGALGWGLLLLWGATQGPVLGLAGLLGGILGGLPGAAILLIALLFPALLAGGAAGVASSAREMMATTSRETQLPL